MQVILTDLASRSSLDDVAWALIYHDLPRIFLLSGDKTYDRGYTLEETWSKRAHLNGALSKWDDNYGVASLVGWLEDGLIDLQSECTRDLGTIKDWTDLPNSRTTSYSGVTDPLFSSR